MQSTVLAQQKCTVQQFGDELLQYMYLSHIEEWIRKRKI